jgi:hypothetical protein
MIKTGVVCNCFLYIFDAEILEEMKFGVSKLAKM